MRVLVYSFHEFEKKYLEEANSGILNLTFTEKQLSNNTVELSKGFDAISVFSSDMVNSNVIQKLNEYGIKFITTRSVGYDHIDLAGASKHKMIVANVPEYSPYAIAEHSFALLLSLNRKILESQKLMKVNDFRLDNLIGFDLHNKKVGIIGTGKIGQTFGKIANGFGCNLLGYDIEENPSLKDLGLKYTSLNELLIESDIISIHCPLNKQTKYLIDKHELSLLKQGAYIINTSRGAVINTKALLNVLELGKLGGVCLDVYENEKGVFFYDHRKSNLDDPMLEKLRSYKNVIITAHQAFLTNEALQQIAEITIANLNEFFKSGSCIHSINLNSHI